MPKNVLGAVNAVRIAVLALYQHLGNSEVFLVIAVENGNIVDDAISNPGHKPGFLPSFLADRAENVIISGGMDGGAVDIFNGRNVEVIVGASGNSKAAIEKYIKGKLKNMFNLP